MGICNVVNESEIFKLAKNPSFHMPTYVGNIPGYAWEFNSHRLTTPQLESELPGQEEYKKCSETVMSPHALA